LQPLAPGSWLLAPGSWLLAPELLVSKRVAGFEEVDYISIRNTGDPGLEDVVGLNQFKI
jgi:hypothetical protein